MTDNHLVSEPYPWPAITALGSWLRIAQSFSFLPYTRLLTCPSIAFTINLVENALGVSRNLVILLRTLRYKTSICILMNFHQEDNNCLSERRASILSAGCFSGLPLNPLLILNLLLHVLNAVGRLHIQRDCLARKCLNKNLHVCLYCIMRIFL